jgi:hypothetical protein
VRLALAEGIEPRSFSLGLAAALRLLAAREGRDPRDLPVVLWPDAPGTAGRGRVVDLALDALGRLDAALARIGPEVG